MTEFRLKCWVLKNSEKFFGPGPMELLQLIHKHGSLSKAAKMMKMSYKKAWDITQHLNTNGKAEYVQLQKGGKAGGGAIVTPHGLNILYQYQKLQKGLSDVLKKNEKILNAL